MANYTYRFQLQRPENMRLLISIRFVMTNILATQNTDEFPAIERNTDEIPCLSLAGKQVHPVRNSQPQRSKMTMRLKLVGLGRSKLKEYHNAKSLPA